MNEPVTVTFPTADDARSVAHAAELRASLIRSRANDEDERPSVRSICSLEAENVGRGIAAIVEALDETERSVPSDDDRCPTHLGRCALERGHAGACVPALVAAER